MFIVTHVIPFRVQFRSGISLFEQIVYASKRAMVSGQLRPGDPFSIRSRLEQRTQDQSKHQRHKIVAYLVNEGLLETRPGIGTVVAVLPDSSRKERTQLLGHEIEELVVEAKRLGIEQDDMPRIDHRTLAASGRHGSAFARQLLQDSSSARKPKDGGRNQQ